MADSLGDYALKITADNREFIEGLNVASTRLKRFSYEAWQASRASQAVSSGFGGGSKTSFAIQQLAFGAQDAATVFGTSGLAGAVRAASNNVVQFGSLLGPKVGIALAVAGTGVALLSDYFDKASRDAKKLTNALEEQSAALRALKADLDLIERVQNAQKISGINDIDRAIKDQAHSLETADEKLQAAINRRNKAERRTAHMKNVGIGNTIGVPGTAGAFDVTKEMIDEAEKAAKELDAEVRKLEEARNAEFQKADALKWRREEILADELNDRLRSQAGERFQREIDLIDERRRREEEAQDAAIKKAEDAGKLFNDIMSGNKGFDLAKLESNYADQLKQIAESSLDEASKGILTDQLTKSQEESKNRLLSRGMGPNNFGASAAELGTEAAWSRIVGAMAPNKRTGMTEAEKAAYELGKLQLDRLSKLVENTKNAGGIVGVSLTQYNSLWGGN